LLCLEKLACSRYQHIIRAERTEDREYYLTFDCVAMLRLFSAGVATVKSCSRNTIIFSSRNFHRSAPTFGLEEFFDPKVEPGQVLPTGRGWNVPELRRKVRA
jgi:hypothetical protein